jgi:pimeloyl-ACP methyl ester carboxylesterase
MGPLRRQISAKDGLSLYVEDWGDPLSPATPLLCLSGLTRNARDFRELAERQARHRRVVLFDYRGRGRSGRAKDWRSYRAEANLDDVFQVVAATGLHGFAVIGTSLGGLLAMALGLVMPSAFKGAVINDIGPEFAAGGVERIASRIGRDEPQADWAAAARHIAESFPPGSYPRADEATYRKLAETTFLEGEDGKLHYSWDLALARAMAEDKRTQDLWPLFLSLKHKPVLLLRGETSDLLSRETAERMAERHPGLTLVEVGGTPHAPTLDEPEAEHAIDEFLARLDP